MSPAIDNKQHPEITKLIVEFGTAGQIFAVENAIFVQIVSCSQCFIAVGQAVGYAIGQLNYSQVRLKITVFRIAIPLWFFYLSKKMLK